MTVSRDSLSLRPSTSEDAAFLLELYKSSRGDDLRALGWDESRIDEFLTMQYQAKHSFEHHDYPLAKDEIVMTGDRPIGRLSVERRDYEIRIVDLGLVPQYRNRGVGTSLIHKLQEQARAEDLPLRLQVMIFSQAVNLFERLGFVRTSETGSHFQMEWSPK